MKKERGEIGKGRKAGWGGRRKGREGRIERERERKEGKMKGEEGEIGKGGKAGEKGKRNGGKERYERKGKEDGGKWKRNERKYTTNSSLPTRAYLHNAGEDDETQFSVIQGAVI